MHPATDRSSTVAGAPRDDLPALPNRLPAVEQRRRCQAVSGQAGWPPESSLQAGPIWPSSPPPASPPPLPPSSRATRSWPRRSSCRGRISTHRDRRRREFRLGRTRSWPRPARQRGHRDRRRHRPGRDLQGAGRIADTKSERTLALSTGVIGVRLPLTKVRDGLARLVPDLAGTDAGLEAVAGAMMTTDTKIKLATTSLALPGPEVR